MARYESIFCFSNKQYDTEKQGNAETIIGYRKSIILEESQLVLIFPTEAAFPEISFMEFPVAYTVENIRRIKNEKRVYESATYSKPF